MLKPGRPRHEQISDWLREQIDRGLYTADQRLPSESEIGQRFGVSRITVRRALHTLQHEHRIYRRQGLGSFVQGKVVRRGLVRLTDFVEDMAEAGLEAASNVEFFGPVDPPPEVSEALGLKSPAKAWRLDRLRLGDGEPIAFDETWLPPFFAHLLEGRDLERETIYDIFEQQHKIPVVSGRYRIEAVNADDHLAEHLDVEPGHALLLIERTSSSENDRPIYFQRRYYRTGRVAYELELKRDPNRPDQTDALVVQEFEPVFNRDR